MNHKFESPITTDFIDHFVDALIRDAQGLRTDMHFVRTKNGFFVESFGISESCLTLSKEWSDESSARFILKVEKPDGTPVLSCTETSKDFDNEAELRKLYGLLDEKLPVTAPHDVAQDMCRFVEKKAFDTFFDGVLTHGTPIVAPIDPNTDEDKVLIYDIFYGIGEASVIRHFLDEIAIRKGPLSEPEYKRYKALAQSAVAMIRNTTRHPNGMFFNGLTVPFTCDSPGTPSCQARFASSISRIANAFTTWPHDIFGDTPATSEAQIAHRCAVLILAAILADQIS